MANTVAVMVEYMDVLTEKYNLLHHQLLEARIMVDKNHIVIQRDKLPDKAVTKSRSVSLVCPPTSLPTVVRRASVASGRLANNAGGQVTLLDICLNVDAQVCPLESSQSEELQEGPASSRKWTKK